MNIMKNKIPLDVLPDTAKRIVIKTIWERLRDNRLNRAFHRKWNKEQLTNRENEVFIGLDHQYTPLYWNMDNAPHALLIAEESEKSMCHDLLMRLQHGYDIRYISDGESDGYQFLFNPKRESNESILQYVIDTMNERYNLIKKDDRALQDFNHIILVINDYHMLTRQQRIEVSSLLRLGRSAKINVLIILNRQEDTLEYLDNEARSNIAVVLCSPMAPVSILHNDTDINHYIDTANDILSINGLWLMSTYGNIEQFATM